MYFNLSDLLHVNVVVYIYTQSTFALMTNFCYGKNLPPSDL